MSDDCPLQWWSWKIWNLCSHRHGPQQDDEGIQGDWHRRHPGAHQRPEVRHGPDQVPVWVLSGGGGGGDTRDPQVHASVMMRTGDWLTDWHTTRLTVHWCQRGQTNPTTWTSLTWYDIKSVYRCCQQSTIKKQLFQVAFWLLAWLIGNANLSKVALKRIHQIF